MSAHDHHHGPGITQSDLLVINKTGLAPAVGAGPDAIIAHVLHAWQHACEGEHHHHH